MCGAAIATATGVLPDATSTEGSTPKESYQGMSGAMKAILKDKLGISSSNPSKEKTSYRPGEFARLMINDTFNKKNSNSPWNKANESYKP